LFVTLSGTAIGQTAPYPVDIPRRHISDLMKWEPERAAFISFSVAL